MDFNFFKKSIQPNVLSDVLLSDYILKKEENERFNLDSRWTSSESFYDFVVAYKIAIVLLALLNVERKNRKFLQVRLKFENSVFMDGNIQKRDFYAAVKTAMDKLGELIDPSNYKLDSLADQNSKLPWTMACLRATGVLGKDQAIVRSGSSVIGMGWAMAWLKDVGITETNPVRLDRFALMWMDNYITISSYLNKYNPTA